MLLGLDLGTGSAKAVLLDPDGSVIAQATKSYAVNAAQPTWAESNPNDWWNAVAFAARAVTQGRQISAIGLSGQMHSVVLCDKRGHHIRNAILWADGRATTELKTFKRLEPTLLGALGNPAVVGMTALTLLWLKNHEPKVYNAAVYALQPKDWLGCALTGSVQTDPSDASATLLYDLQSDTWHPSLMQTLGLRTELLPNIISSSAVIGTLTTDSARAFGIRPGIPVVLGAGDTAAALIGSGLSGLRSAQLTIGTGAQIVTLRQTPTPHATHATHLYRCAFGEPRWYAMAAIQNAGLALETVRKWLGLSWKAAYHKAFSLPAGSHGLTFYPYLTGERSPHNNADLRGAWQGLALNHTRAHLMRAAFEGVAYAIRDGLQTLEADGSQRNAEPLELRLAGGGTTDPAWRQLLADLLERPIHAVDTSNASARGAALLAGLGTDLIPADDLESYAPPCTLVADPNAALSQVSAQGYQRFVRGQSSLKDLTISDYNDR